MTLGTGGLQDTLLICVTVGDPVGYIACRSRNRDIMVLRHSITVDFLLPVGILIAQTVQCVGIKAAYCTAAGDFLRQFPQVIATENIEIFNGRTN